ncbi:Hypothetical predicted protein [Pelobates cultripes]|uniref:Uncharacterized protein n=1 Tax=Pelobates cultripes TaxID=61616 RepID=A0AAD1R774_PELCU|nr:Hypothetical predicted protein [Pelobates cultripes]
MAEIHTLRARTTELEQRVESTVAAHNVATEHINRLTTRLEASEAALEDLANPSRRNNLRIRGLPEQADEGPLAATVPTILLPNLPEIPDERWLIDRAHRSLP